MIDVISSHSATLTLKIHLTMVSNQAAWIPEPHGQLVIRDAPDYDVGEKDVLIENKAVAINPGKKPLNQFILNGGRFTVRAADWKIQDYNVMVKGYPTVGLTEPRILEYVPAQTFCSSPGVTDSW